MVETTTPQAPALITTHEAAKRLTASTSHVRNMIRAGELTGVRIGRNLRVTAVSLADYLERHTVSR